MEITRRRSERAKVKKATYTPGKLVTKARNKIPPEVKDNWFNTNIFVFPFRTASDSETTAPVLSLVSVLSIDRPELFITVFVMILNSTYGETNI
jgi:hypothetical protein